MMINKRLLNVCETSKKYMLLTVLASWVGLLANILIIVLLGLFINQVLSSDAHLNHFSFIDFIQTQQVTTHLNVLSAGLLILLLLVIKYLAHHFKVKFSYYASKDARQTLRHMIFDKLLSLGLDYQETQKTSAIVQVSVEGIEQLEIYFGRYLPQFFYALLAPLTLFVVLSFISIQAAMIFMLGVPLIPISIIAIMKIAKRILSEYWNNYANLGDTFLENLQGLSTLKVFNQDETYHQSMNEEAEGFRRITMKVLSMQLNSINIMDLIAFGGSALGTIVGLVQFRNGELQVGDLMIIILLSSEFFIPLRLLGSYFHIAMNGMAASDRIFELLDTPSNEQTGELITADGPPTMRVEDLTFSYDGQKEVLQNISMTLRPHEVTAIVGQSGSGKSTLAALLVRQKHPTQGVITFNDQSIASVNLSHLYEQVALVSAHSYIFKGTIRENLLLADAMATEKQLMHALKVARMDSFVSSLPNGLDTFVTEGGASLSGGQKQRLALARVILGNRSVILFDEATSNIDVESEEAIWDAIYELKQTKTIGVITHRLANIKAADSIYVLASGKLVEHGQHDDLMAQKGDYATMVKQQQKLEQIREVL